MLTYNVIGTVTNMQLCHTNLLHRYHNGFELRRSSSAAAGEPFHTFWGQISFFGSTNTHLCWWSWFKHNPFNERPTFVKQHPAKVSVNIDGWAAFQLNPLWLQKYLGDFGVLLFKGYTCIGMTFMERSSEEKISWIPTSTFHVRNHKFDKEHPDNPCGSCGKIRFQQNSLGASSKGLFGEKRRRIWGDPARFGVVLQSVGKSLR